MRSKGGEEIARFGNVFEHVPQRDHIERPIDVVDGGPNVETNAHRIGARRSRWLDALHAIAGATCFIKKEPMITSHIQPSAGRGLQCADRLQEREILG